MSLTIGVITGLAGHAKDQLIVRGAPSNSLLGGGVTWIGLETRGYKLRHLAERSGFFDVSRIELQRLNQL